MDNNQNNSERLRNLIARFVLKYNFWGYLFSRVKRQSDTNIQSIMGVCPELDGTITLRYNPELLEQTDDKNLLVVIEHEGMHLLNKHIPRLLRIISNEVDEYAKQSKAQIWNVAADCAVNEQAKLKDNLIIAGKKWELCFPAKYKLEAGQTSEAYYLELLKNAKKVYIPSFGGSGGSGSDGDQDSKSGKAIGDHSGWLENIKNTSDLSSLSRKVDQHIRNIIKDSAKTFNKDRGTLPAHIAQLIQAALEPPKAPYYQIIQKLVKGTRYSKFMSSPTRINRKRAYTFTLDETMPQISPFPGKKRDFTFNIAVLIDTSGSMSNDDILEGLSGLKNIIEKDRYCKTVVLEVDAGVEKEYICKKIKDIQFNIKGRGGTTLGPGLFRAQELGVDVCLAFTDGYTENINEYPRKKLPKKIIWVITNNGTSENVNKTGWVIKL